MPVKSRIPAYRHHKARNLAVVRINGLDHYLGPWKSKASYLAYDRIITEWIANGRRLPTESPSAARTTSELIAAFYGHCKSYYQDEGRRGGNCDRVKRVLTVLRELYGAQPALDFGPLKLKAVRQKMVDKGWSRRSINEGVNRIRKLFRWSASEEMIPASIPQALETLEGLRSGRSDAKEGKRILPVEQNVIDATLPFLPQVVRDMVTLQQLLGCRPGELCIMRPMDIDRTGDVWRYVPAKHKTEHHGKDRVIFIGPQSQAILLPYLLRDAQASCFSPAESEKKRRAERHEQRKTPLNEGNAPGRRLKPGPCPPGDRYDDASYRRSVHRACRKAKVKQWSPNQLRHSRGTEIRQKFGLESAQVVLGHSNARITEVYAERDHALAVRVAREVG